MQKRYKSGNGQLAEHERRHMSERRRRELERKTSFLAKIHYSYTVNAKDYEGQRVSFGSVSTNNPEDAQRVLRRYPERKIVKVYYHPKKPTDSVLEPGITGSTFFLPGLGGCLCWPACFLPC